MRTPRSIHRSVLSSFHQFDGYLHSFQIKNESYRLFPFCQIDCFLIVICGGHNKTSPFPKKKEKKILNATARQKLPALITLSDSSANGR